MPEVLKILEESKENIIVNKKLTETSNELKEISSQLQNANNNLLVKDKQKDEFLDTVTHELEHQLLQLELPAKFYMMMMKFLKN